MGKHVLVFLAGIMLLLLTCGGTVMIVLVLEDRVVDSSISKLELGMTRGEVNRKVGPPTSRSIEHSNGFPLPHLITQKIVIGDTSSFESVDSYLWGLGLSEFWLYFDADEKLVAIVEVFTN